MTSPVIDPAELLALADRVEAAMGADEQLDREIALAVYGVWYEGIARCVPTHIQSVIPRYSSSLDAAMTLVPEGLSFEVRRSGTGDQGQATIWNPMRIPGHPSEVHVTGCATPALALTAAALRARAQETPSCQ